MIAVDVTEPDLLTNDGPLLSLAEAGRLLPGRGTDHPSPSCLSRWITKGVVGVGGHRHKLPAVRVGSYWRTTANAVRRFVRATSGQPNDPPARAASEARSPGQRQAASERAAAELSAMNV